LNSKIIAKYCLKQSNTKNFGEKQKIHEVSICFTKFQKLIFKDCQELFNINLILKLSH
jgi:hypothetical protein